MNLSKHNPEEVPQTIKDIEQKMIMFEQNRDYVVAENLRKMYLLEKHKWL